MKYYSSNETSPFWMPPNLSSRASSKTSCVCRNAGFLGLFDASLIGLVASFPIHCALIIQYCKYKIFGLLNAMDDKLKRSGGPFPFVTEAQVELGTGACCGCCKADLNLLLIFALRWLQVCPSTHHPPPSISIVYQLTVRTYEGTRTPHVVSDASCESIVLLYCMFELLWKTSQMLCLTHINVKTNRTM